MFPILRYYYLLLYGAAMVALYTAFLVLVGEFTKKEWDYIMEAVNPVELSSTDSQSSNFTRQEEQRSPDSQIDESARPNETEIDVDEPITGHIDLVQIKYDNLYILDYITKPTTWGA